MSDEKIALYFGCWGQSGHYLWLPNERKIYRAQRDIPGFLWDEALLDTGLLKNGNHRDIVDGKVFWTLGGKNLDCLWHAFFWWDRSGDARANSNSGFYTYGFSHRAEVEAFAYACAQFPAIVKRQGVPLELQGRHAEGGK